MVDLFATSLSNRLPVYFSLLNDPMAVGTDAFLQSWDGLQAYAFPPFSFIKQVLNKLWSCKGTLLMLVSLYWYQNEWFLDLVALSVAAPVALPARTDLLRQPHFHHLHQNLHVLHLHAWRLQQFARHIGLSWGVACQLALCHCSSSRRLYQHRWECY